MLAQKQPLMNEIGEALDDVVAEGKRAGDVIRRLRGMLKRGERNVEVYSPNELVSSVLHLLRSEVVARQVRVHLDLGPDLPDMAGDRVQIQQVLTNLLMNALDAVNSPGVQDRVITVSTASPRPGYVETAVTDHGPGIADEQHARVLEPFFTTKPTGLGLGLSICNSIVKAHGGVLGIVNGRICGVRASFTLPIRGPSI
jgi:signal transduction histidine kinase